uniref:Uncharacterized protein n=1 Tax=Panagrolaimus sp. ES5 TaxID=591445 RepID=A0AC34FCY6_9BILA
MFRALKLQINIVDVLCIDEELSQFHRGRPYDLQLLSTQLDKLPNNLWLPEALLLGGSLDVPKFLSKIVKCNLDNLYLVVDTKFTINELKFLTQSKTIKTINIDRIIYKSHENDAVAPLEDVLSYFLSANSISFDICHVTNETMKKLLLLNFHQKLDCFSLYQITQINGSEMMDANLMDEFLKKNLADNACLYFNHVDEIDDQIFKLQMFKKLRAWSPEEKKPRTFPDCFR